MVEGDKAASMTGSLVATQIFSGNVNFLREGLYLCYLAFLSLSLFHLKIGTILTVPTQWDPCEDY